MAALKPVSKFLTKAKELDKHDPVMSYYCKCPPPRLLVLVCESMNTGQGRTTHFPTINLVGSGATHTVDALSPAGRMHAVMTGLKLPNRTKDDTNQLLAIMDWAEQVCAVCQLKTCVLRRFICTSVCMGVR